MCYVFFSALSRGAGALQIPIIIFKFMNSNRGYFWCPITDDLKVLTKSSEE